MSCFCVNWILLILFAGPTVSESPVKGEVGQNVTVPCFYSAESTQDITSMCWGRGSCPISKCSQTIIWTDGWKVTEQHNSRYTLKGDLTRGDVSLTIVNAEEGDSGTYCCRVEISGWFNDQRSNHEVVIEKARISTASPHTYTSEQTSAHGSTSESSFSTMSTWPSVSALEAPLANMSVSIPRQQYSENWLYIGTGLCAALLVILTLALFLTRRKYFWPVVIQSLDYLHNTKKTSGFAHFVAFWRPKGAGNHSALEEETHTEENVYIIP